MNTVNQFMKKMPVRCCLPMVLLLALSSRLPAAAAVDRGSEQDRLCDRIEILYEKGGLSIHGEAVAAVSLIPEIYDRNDYSLIWRRERNMNELLDMVEASRAEGLTPADYHQETLNRMMQRYRSGSMTPCERADLDILMTDGLIRLGYHLMYGKVNPRRLDPDWNLKRDISGRDPVELIQSAIEADSLSSYLQQLTPVVPLYARMKRELAQYRAIEAQGGWPKIPPGPTIKLGDSDPRVAAIGELLRVTGDLHGPAATDPSRYDARVEQAVSRFQRRHGLEVDGAVGRNTTAAMNVPVAARIDQIRVNMERSRWVLRDVPDDFLIIDIAGFKVALVRGKRSVWEAAVQVGTPYRKTPVFQGEMKYLVFNPTWTVPPTIFKKDILPKLKSDPDYLEKKNMRVIDHQGNSVDTATIDWSTVSHRDFPYLIRQDPGPHNALGRIKFMFPNKHSVYMHDTPNQSGFRQQERTFSSGCIRVERPFELAEFLLNDPDNWSPEKIAQAVDSGETQTVPLKKRLPVFLLYWTVGADDDNFYFKPDVYRRDSEVLHALNGDFRFDPPDDMPAWYRTGTSSDRSRNRTKNGRSSG